MKRMPRVVADAKNPGDETFDDETFLAIDDSAFPADPPGTTVAPSDQDREVSGELASIAVFKGR
ncbi:MAG: hypothetical protein HOL85_05045 [Rhodospirillaceae bacterium]|nr:hypothetical protein [Rhodospirillaceae bacterium]